jgi:hypothetical protein
MTPNVKRLRFWIALIGALSLASPGFAEMIRWGYEGSIFGGGGWEVHPGDRVVYRAYQADGALTQQAAWVWDDKVAKLGHITFAIPGAYGTASRIVMARIRDAGLGPAVRYLSNCSDAGFFTVVVDTPAFAYAAQLDNCIPQSPDAPPAARAQYDALRAATAEISTALQLDGLLAP